ncbi:threonine-rich protein [Lucilia sericata]|uniref:threonine-rich protein n=1 Tax=Lucilia sericata TaxID=13632 RepID=UPI0018A82F60|nr:threonine-rich protein [Lucilia sericata]
MLKLVFIFALSIGCIQYAKAVCHVCNERNGVACISETEFHPCFGNVPDTSLKFSCLGENEICTIKGKACMDKDLPVSPACGDTSNCGKCSKEPNADGMFACTSRTTFTMCLDGELSDIRLTCPEDQICDISKGKNKEYPCVPSCKENEIEFCDLYDPIDVPVTTTPEPTTTTELPTTTTEMGTTMTTTEKDTTTTTEKDTTTTTTEKDTTTTTTEKDTTATTTTEKYTTEPITTTTEKITTTTEEITTTTIFAPTPPEVITTTTEEPTTTENPAELVCSQQTAAGRYPYPNDTTCKNYIYCFKKGGAMQTTFLKCPPELYFNPSTSLCGQVKPEGCL